MNIIGIDPGIDGAVALIIPESTLYIADVPTENIVRNGKLKREFLPHEMAKLIRDYMQYGPTQVYIEQVSAMRKKGVTQGTVSMFGFGKGYGIWIGILAACGVPYTFVTPQAWKKVMLAGKGDKNASRGVAQSQFPNHVDMFKRVKDHNRAEAALIALYGKRMLRA